MRNLLAICITILLVSPALAHGGNHNAGHVTIRHSDHRAHYPHTGGGPYPFNECGMFVGPVFVRSPCL